MLEKLDDVKMATRSLAVTSLVLGAVALLLGACGSEVGQGSLAQPVDDGGLILPADARSGADTVVPADTTAPADGTTTGLPVGSPCAQDAECQAGWCLPTADGWRCPQTCAVQACSPDETCLLLTHPDGLVGRVCAARDVTLCQPCTSHADCNLIPDGLQLNRCVDLGDVGRFCGVACGETLPACPDGYACGVDGQCRPESKQCERCTALSVASGAHTTCHVSGAPEACQGTRSCTADGLTACWAPGGGEETCNGQDDDCDGLTDEDVIALCGPWACAGEAGCKTSCAGAADCAPGYGCDPSTGTCAPTGENGAVCEDAGQCDSGYCANGHCCAGPDASCCAEDADCAALDEAPVCAAHGPDGCSGTQVVGRCVDAACAAETVATPAGCENAPCLAGECGADGVFHVPSRCDDVGACVPAGPDVDCDDHDPCTLDDCTVATGCGSTPYTGQTQSSCYGFDPATRGRGACHDGVLRCEGGAATDCLDDQGPTDEVCNGVDDDCDDATDEGTGYQCAPYRCGGTEGCRTSCASSADCIPSAFCDDAGHCQFAGHDGEPCSGPDECESGYCANGFCCASGMCCGDDGACASLDTEACASATAAGCAGTRTLGACDAGTHQCVATTVADPAVCSGTACAGAACVGDTLTTGSRCDEAGACVPNADATDCSPFACLDASCGTGCGANDDCVDGAACVQGACVGATPNGDACTSDAQCVSEHCDNGYCCDSGVCCAASSDCGALDEAPVCDDPGSCAGSQAVGICGVDHRCWTTTVSAPAGCEGRTCGDAECRNLSGGSFILEGVRRRLCNGAGACVSVDRDCRSYNDGGFCSNNSATFAWCAGCSPNRSTCVDLSDPCSCE
ncbi:MAG: hypothetical protein EP329_13035 [Deltaproteobacteria bacterium]|nr:MAG: hypothetical protein EP329_13035 [Deltaproteobacteria bacterium]